jgi:hypothetical protein
MSDESPKKITRSGRAVKKPTRYEPDVHRFEDDFGDDEYDSNESSSVGSSIGYDSNEGGDSQEYDSSFVTNGSVSDPDWTDDEFEEEMAESTEEADTTDTAEELDSDDTDSKHDSKRQKCDTE